MNFNTVGMALCGEEQPWFLGIFDFTVAPPLLFYSYVPILFATLLIGTFIYLNNKRSLQSKLLLTVSIAFALWVINILVLWIASYHSILMFTWQLTAAIELALFLSIAYFAFVFFFKRDLPFIWKLFGSILMLVVLALTPTTLNVASYDLTNCEGNNGLIWDLLYGLEPFIIAITVIFGLIAQYREKDPVYRTQIWLLTIGLAIFETFFYVSNFYGELTQVYEFNFWGPLGMFFFILLLGYVIVRFQAFNVKLLAAQALVAATILLIASQYFFSTNSVSIALVTATLLISMVFGFLLVRSVEREVAQRERIEALAKELEKSNKQQIILIHFITHQIKGFLTKSRNIFAMALDGDFGSVPETLKPMMEEGFKSDTKGVNTIQDILTAANIKSGKVTYEHTAIDLKAVVEEVSKDLKLAAEAKGLAFTLDLDPLTIQGDKLQLTNAFKNLIDNSIKYTLTGSVNVSLKPADKNVRFMIQDTGVGISKEDMHKLFTEGGHGANSQKVNVESTGFGLYIVKNIIEAHHGRVWAESEGEGKGSRFIVELPL